MHEGICPRDGVGQLAGVVSIGEDIRDRLRYECQRAAILVGTAIRVRWAGLFLLLVAPLGILFLVVGGALSPETDLGFWSALSVPYAIARVLLPRTANPSDQTSAAAAGQTHPPRR